MLLSKVVLFRTTELVPLRIGMQKGGKSRGFSNTILVFLFYLGKIYIHLSLYYNMARKIFELIAFSYNTSP